MKILHITSRIVICLFFVFSFKISSAQNVGINSSGAAPDASAGLDISFTDRGFLAPRLTTAQRNAISSPADGLLIYQTDGTKGLYFYNTTTTAWTSAALSITPWSITGNSGIATSTNFLGTTDNVSLKFRTNNIHRMVLDSVGNLGIGTTVPGALLDVNSSTSAATPTTLAKFRKSITGTFNYAALQLLNSNASGSGTRLLMGGAATANQWSINTDIFNNNSQNFYIYDNGAAATRLYIDANGNVGIGGTPTYLGTNYLQLLSSSATSSGEFIAMGGSTTSHQWTIGTDGFSNNTQSFYINDNSSATPTRFWIASNGNVGLGGNVLPGSTLDITGTLNTSGAAAIGGTTTLGTNGTALTNIIKTSISLSGTIAINTTTVKTATVTNSILNATVMVSPRTALPNGVAIAWARVSVAGTVAVGFITTTTASATLSATTFDVTLIQ